MSLRSSKKVPAVIAVIAAVVGLLAATGASARLSIIPGGKPTPRPTSSSTAPTPTPTAVANASVMGCQRLVASESATMLAEVRSALGECLTRGWFYDRVFAAVEHIDACLGEIFHGIDQAFLGALLGERH